MYMAKVVPFGKEHQPAPPAAKKKSRKRTGYPDYALLAVVIILVCFGLVMLYSASAYEAASSAKADDMYYFRRQLLISLFSFAVAIGVSRFDYHLFIAGSYVLYWTAFILMLAVRTPLGVTINGARRWLRLGIQFQPSEVAKIAVILCMSYMLIEVGKRLKTKKVTLNLLGAVILQAGGAYLLTDNLSTAVIIFGIGFGMLYLLHPNKKLFIVVVLAVVIVVILGLILLDNYMQSTDDFRMIRIAAWMHKEQYANDEGYQVMQGLYAIGRGGFLGQGLGNSTQKLSTIPEAQNDMIFTIICEELGLFGALLVIILFGYLLYRLFIIAQNAPDLYGSLVASGIFIHIALQVILNICVVLYIIPTTGVTLPFVSYGGTSVVFLMFEVGLALGISRQIPDAG